VLVCDITASNSALNNFKANNIFGKKKKKSHDQSYFHMISHPMN